MSPTEAERTVLLVREEGEAREVLAEHLALNGFEVFEASTGVEALRLLGRAAADAAVLDLAMPRLGGVEALRGIRLRHPAVAVITLVEEGDDEVYWRALELGAHDVLPATAVPGDVLESLESRPPSPGARGGPAAPPAPADAATAARTLVVDDDPDVRTRLVEYLSARGHRVGAAPESAAEHAMVTEAPDVVLLDISRAAAQEIDTLPTIRAFAPRAAVILMGTVAEIEIGRRGFARGAFDFVTKPLDLDALAETVEAALTLRRLLGGERPRRA
jgi:DNA-binding NtrC family response regulator